MIGRRDDSRISTVRQLTFSIVLATSLVLVTSCETTSSNAVPDGLASDEIRTLQQQSEAIDKFLVANKKALAELADSESLLSGPQQADLAEVREQLATATASLRSAGQRAEARRTQLQQQRDQLVAEAKANADRQRQQAAQRKAEEARRQKEEAAARKAAEKQQRQLAKEKAALEKLRREQAERRQRLQAAKAKREAELAEARAEAEAAKQEAEARSRKEMQRIAEARNELKQTTSSEQQAAIADAERRLAQLRQDFEKEEKRILADKERTIAELAKKQAAANQDLAAEERRLQESLAEQEKRVEDALQEARKRDAEVEKLIKTETREWSANLRALEAKLNRLEQANKTYLIRELVVTGDRDAVRGLSSWRGYQGYANQELAVPDLEAIRSRLAQDLRRAGYSKVSVEISEPSLDLGFLKFRVSAER